MLNCNKTIVLLMLFALFTQVVFAQNKPGNKLTLKTGEVYTGEILLQNDEIVLIKLANGARFQFRKDEIKSIANSTEEDLNQSAIRVDSVVSGNLCGMLDVSGGFNSAPAAYKPSSFFDVSLSFGIKSNKEKSLFAGLGAGYFNVINAGNNLGFIPVFLRFGSNNIAVKRTSPFFLLDVGYSFDTGFRQAYHSGIFSKLAIGVIHRLNYKTSVFAGPFTSVHMLNGLLTEDLGSSVVTYNGSTAIYCFGLKAGLQF